MRQLISGMVGLAIVGIAGSANAAIISTFTDRTAFDAVTTTSLETFNSIVSEVPFHTTPLDVGPFTLSMTGSPNTNPARNKIDIPPAEFGVFDVDGTNIANVLTFNGDSLFLTFDTAITAFGLDLADFNDGGLRTQIVVGLDTLTPAVTGGSAVRFFGFTSDTAFTSVEFRSVINDGYGFDNVAFGGGSVAVPEPGVLAMLGIGLVGLGFLRRRKTA